MTPDALSKMKVVILCGGLGTRLREEIEYRPKPLVPIGDRPILWHNGVADLDLEALARFHQESGCAVALTGVRPLSRFGELMVSGDLVVRFAEKPAAGDAWINGGYSVMTPGVYDYLDGDQAILERHPLERLAAQRGMGVRACAMEALGGSPGRTEGCEISTQTGVLNVV